MRVKTVIEGLTIPAGTTYNSPAFRLESAPWEDYALIQWTCTSIVAPQSVTLFGRPTPTSPWGQVYTNAALAFLTKTTFCPEYYISITASATDNIIEAAFYIGR